MNLSSLMLQETAAAPSRAEGSRGQRQYPLLHVTQLMLPLLSALRARSCHAPASVIRRFLLGALIATQAAATGSFASEALIIGNVPGDQDNPSAALAVGGGFIVWEDNRVQQGRDGKGIAAAAVSGDMQTVGAPFKVSTQKEGRQERPQIVALSGGEHLVVWEVRNGKTPGVFARVLGTNGNFVSSDVMVNVPTAKLTQKVSTNWTASYRGNIKSRKHNFKQLITNTREQAGAASVVALPDGGAVVVYHAMHRTDTNSWRLEGRTLLSKGQFIQDSVLRPFRSGSDRMSDVFLQRLDAAGKKVGGEILVNQSEEFNQRNPSIALLPNGNLIVVWVTETPMMQNTAHLPNFRVSVAARLFDAQGQPASDEFSVATPDGAAQANPVAHSLVDGGFLVLWSQQESAGRGWDVFARAFTADREASGAAFRVNNHTAGDQFGPCVAGTQDRLFVAWTSVGQDGSREGIYGRHFHGGVLSGDEFLVNDTTNSRQWHPVVKPDGNGGVAVLWSGFTGATGFDLYGTLLQPDSE